MCLHVGNWKKLYHKAFSWKLMMYVFLTVSLILLVAIVVFLVVTANQDDNVIVVLLSLVYSLDRYCSSAFVMH